MHDYTIHDFDYLFSDRRDLKGFSLILGNGSSIAVNDCFQYGNLYDKACGGSILDQSSKDLFDALDTTDFELVMNKLRQAYVINKVLGLDSDNIAAAAYDKIRSSLILAVNQTHVQYCDVISKIDKISVYLELFKTVISLNYDLLVYWALMASNERVRYKIKDCFLIHVDENLGFEYNIDKLRGQCGSVTNPTLVFYPHGNLILASNERDEEIKIVAGNTGSLLDEINDKWKRGYVPLFVSEGSSEQKLRAIRRSAYLNYVYESVLPDLGHKIIIYGWKMAEQDEHLIKNIFGKGDVSEIYISVHADADLTYRSEQERIVNCLERIVRSMSRDINIRFFDAASINCWCY